MNLKRFMAVMFALLVGLSFSSTRVAAQTQSTGDVTGVVTDPTGGVVPNAKVSLKDATKGGVQDSVTNKDGAYRFYLLPPGPYVVTVTATGFSTQTGPVKVAVGQIATANFALAVGSAQSTITVTESAPLLSVDSGNVATTISRTADRGSSQSGQRHELHRSAVAGRGDEYSGAGYGNFSSFRIAWNVQPVYAGWYGRQRPVPEPEQLRCNEPVARCERSAGSVVVKRRVHR